MQQFDITVPTVGAFTVHAAGRYIKYVAGSNGGGDASLIVTPGAQGGNRITLKPGQAYRVADDKGTPDSWTLQNSAGSATIIGTVVVGDGRIDDTTIAGTVAVVDAGLTRTLINSAFLGTGFATAVASQYSHVMLWNPAGSGKNLILESFNATSPNAAFIATLVFQNATLGTLQASTIASKLASGAPGVAQIYKQQQVGIPAGVQMVSVGGAQNAVVPYTFKEPLVIPPGYGVVSAFVNVQNAGNQTGFEWFEVSQ
jgi:hypothetical protein